jgi:excinuclease ABC subunit C
MSYLEVKSPQLQEKVNGSPLNPGCYIYRDEAGNVLYIGKAKVIRKRVKSYFLNYQRLDPKIQIMLEQVVDVDFIIADSEIEAIILETNLIKKYKPKYNTLMVDDKNYVWIRIDRQKGSKVPANQKGSKTLTTGVDFPTLTIVRKRLDDGAHYFGPYPKTMPVKRTIDNLRKLFPFCTDGKKYDRSNGLPIKISTDHAKPCFHYHIGYCKGACANLEAKEDYNKRINYIKDFFSGYKGRIEGEIETQMLEAAKEHQFEKAAILRDRLNDIKYVTKHIRMDADLDAEEVMKQKQAEQSAALADLVGYLNFANMQLHPDFRIECYDISNIQGTNAVGAMTVLIDGKAEPRLYRKFRIRMKNEPNDFAMMQEILFRRFYSYLTSHQKDQILDLEEADLEIDTKKYVRKATDKVDESFTQVPDLIVIDGGKGQLSSAFKVMRSLNLDLPMIGLAKREEEVFVVDQQRIDPDLINDAGVSLTELTFTKVHLPKNTEASYLLQRVRDEAHRFGITYHRKLRTKQAFEFTDPVKVKKRRARK